MASHLPRYSDRLSKKALWEALLHILLKHFSLFFKSTLEVFKIDFLSYQSCIYGAYIRIHHLGFNKWGLLFCKQLWTRMETRRALKNGHINILFSNKSSCTCIWRLKAKEELKAYDHEQFKKKLHIKAFFKLCILWFIAQLHYLDLWNSC